ncbi:hypothetical protein LCGC14_1106990 [marine sediment metagenome]|uniref:HTH marR-type domain-containing protein n=1 Tax=marine sediment metagenome TaxID=412755 RepID=A0A0F9MVR2_9ZZZZ
MAREDFGRRLPFDPRMLSVIERSPQRMAEQGSGFLQDWGGAGGYHQVAGMKPETRMVFFAVQEGYTEPTQIEVATGLSGPEVSRGMQELERKGLVTVEELAL